MRQVRCPYFHPDKCNMNNWTGSKIWTQKNNFQPRNVHTFPVFVFLTHLMKWTGPPFVFVFYFLLLKMIRFDDSIAFFLNRFQSSDLQWRSKFWDKTISEHYRGKVVPVWSGSFQLHSGWLMKSLTFGWREEKITSSACNRRVCMVQALTFKCVVTWTTWLCFLCSASVQINTRNL